MLNQSDHPHEKCKVLEYQEVLIKGIKLFYDKL